MCEQRLVDSFNVGDQEPDTDGARDTVGVTYFGEHHAQLRMVGAAFYIDDLTLPGDQPSLPCVGPTYGGEAGPDPRRAPPRPELDHELAVARRLSGRLSGSLSPSSADRERRRAPATTTRSWIHVPPSKVVSEPSTSPLRTRPFSIKGRAR